MMLVLYHLAPAHFHISNHPQSHIACSHQLWQSPYALCYSLPLSFAQKIPLPCPLKAQWPVQSRHSRMATEPSQWTPQLPMLHVEYTSSPQLTLSQSSRFLRGPFSICEIPHMSQQWVKPNPETLDIGQHLNLEEIDSSSN